MSTLSYDVRIWKTEIYQSRRGPRYNTYYVRWRVAENKFKRPFRTSTLAKSFKSELLTAQARGEAFDVVSGLPVSMERADEKRSEDESRSESWSWFDFACSYVDMKWPGAAATTRRSTAEAMVDVTWAMVSTEQGRPSRKILRSALFGWGFNTQHRDDPTRPQEVTAALAWLACNTRPVSDLARPEVLRAVLDTLASKLDGSRAAPTVMSRKRAVLFNALEHASSTEHKLLAGNPIPALKFKAPKRRQQIDKRSVVNPIQARTLLNQVSDTKRSGRRLMACYACSYYSGLRPEEAINLRRQNIVLPALVWSRETQRWEDSESDWGEFHLDRVAPSAGRRWTDSGKDRDDRGLKHRAADDVRIALIPPELVVILRRHIATFPPGPDGQIFTGERGGPVPVITYNRIWREAREAAFTPDVAGSPLALTPYDLRHACLSGQLSAGVDPSRVAALAGNSVEVLLRVYAQCIDRGEALDRQKIADHLAPPRFRHAFGADIRDQPDTSGHNRT